MTAHHLLDSRVYLYGTLPYTWPMAPRASTSDRSTKSARLDLRAEPERAALIAEAAALTHQSVSAFVLDAAAARAREVVDRSAVTALDDERFDQMLEALDGPYVPNAALRRAAQRGS